MINETLNIVLKTLVCQIGEIDKLKMAWWATWPVYLWARKTRQLVIVNVVVLTFLPLFSNKKNES